MRKKTVTVRCATCGAELEVLAEEAEGLHFCGNRLTKSNSCILEYWRGLNEKYGTN